LFNGDGDGGRRKRLDVSNANGPSDDVSVVDLAAEKEVGCGTWGIAVVAALGE
jgi:hypothetical protein